MRRYTFNNKRDEEGLTPDPVGEWVSYDDLTWNPIESAPKDGTFILLLGDSGYTTTPYRVAVGRWVEGYRNHWITHSNDAFTDDGDSPSHWRPWEPPRFGYCPHCRHATHWGEDCDRCACTGRGD